MKLKLLLVLCLLSNVVSAQFVTNSKRVADVYYLNKEYYAAAEYYKKALQISPDSSGFVVPYGFQTKLKQESPKKEDYEYSVFQLAESLRQYKNFTDAEKWYAIAKDFNNPKYILSTFWYGVTLRANQNYTEAITAFETFQKKYTAKDEYAARTKTEIASCQFALYEVSHPRLFKLARLKNDINQAGSNYTPLLRGNNFYFTSSRPIGSGGKNVVLSDATSNSKVTRKQTPYVNAIYETSGNPLKESISIKKIPAISKNKELATPAFLPNGKVMFITGWSAKETRKIYQLNSASATGSDWSEPIELGGNINVKGFNAMQPSVSKNGKYLIFSSDRPGGQGKYDLWYCAIRPDGSLGQAVNMGSTINTPGDEEAPYYNVKTKKLLYSSNGKVGLGGFDFFESDGDFDSWSDPRNLGYPFNSSKDDLYFTPLDDNDVEGYISSDRESLCCLEIFHLKREYLNIKGAIVDCITGKPLDNVVVTLADSMQQFKFTTGADGKYNFRLNSNRQIKITAEKAKYFIKTLSYTYDQLAQKDTLFSEEICLTPYEKDKPIVLKDVLYEFDKADLTADSKVKMDYLYTIMVDNPKIEIELSAHTDSKGTPAYNLDLSDRRAKSCVDYLIAKGISQNRMTSKGYGMTMPVAPNKLPNGKDNPAGRALNRRTEFKVTKN
ncbi:OmpA family protein [Pedobacter caeni]|uniref:Tetratricopeptide repeat-containing protein n=1 Tax=Pedobacter caeni TaxID=288992 RepID=A0A1M5NKL6_9SPHI|nr:OmpA family protein [Pedobacter caeni]SHG90154.1 Tetratricopeptide repeat-containing protein [Pedobacter caeni]